MAHNLFNERYIGRRDKAWHGLGETFPADLELTAVEAIQRARLDYRVEAFPLTANVYGQQVATGHAAIVRQATSDDPEPRVLGVTTEKFTVIQNEDIAQILDKIGLTAQWPVETVGALGMGETIFLTLKAGRTAIADEEIEEYFLISEGKAGGLALSATWTPVRVVCQNTLNAGLSAGASIKVSHFGSVADSFEFYANLVAMMKESREQTLARMQALAIKRVTKPQVRSIIEAAHPLPTARKVMRYAAALGDKVALLDETQQQVLSRETAIFNAESDKITARRDACWDQYERINEQCTSIAQTAWAAWQAVTEVADWRDPATKNERVAESLLFGKRAEEKVRGFKAAVALLK